MLLQLPFSERYGECLDRHRRSIGEVIENGREIDCASIPHIQALSFTWHGKILDKHLL